jgi:hypothetical protein
VVGVRSAEGWHIRFRRTFGLEEMVEWENLCRIFDIHLVHTDEDQVFWALEPSGMYSTHSMYLRVSQGATVTCFKEVWRTRVPPKIRVFFMATD